MRQDGKYLNGRGAALFLVAVVTLAPLSVWPTAPTAETSLPSGERDRRQPPVIVDKLRQHELSG